MKDHEQVSILLVEDSERDAELTRRALRRQHIVNDIVWVKDGLEALDYLFCEGAYAGRDNGPPTLVLLDLKMPRMDGLQVLERLKASELTKSIPVVVVTASRDDSDLVRSYALGVENYIVKPVDFAQFTENVVNAGMHWLLTTRAEDVSGERT